MGEQRVAKAQFAIVGLGVTLFLIAVAHHTREFFVLNRGIGPVAAILLDGPLALGLVYAGYRFSDADFDREDHWRISYWSLLGSVVFVSVMGVTFLIRILEGRIIAEPLFPLLTAAEAGGLAGVIGGYYNARSRRDARQARAAYERVEELNKQLEASNERLEEFAYAASHDLQEPLRMVVKYLELLDERYGDRFDGDAEDFVEYAIDGAERMQRMIESLLAYSRIETDADPFEPVDLEAMLEEVLTDLQIKIEEHDAEITVEELPRVKGDRGQLRQLFQNLLDNAIQYSGDEPPSVRVSAEDDGSEWVISVRDEGIGMDPEQTDRVFEVFQRLHTQNEHPGTGIGLAMCKRIVERHGGEIWIDSAPGEGTTFSLTLSAVPE
ncbi:sensor histidine kinase [Natrinema sp. LN54]|uniref:sensor histidine kinase n=1 Tax=Natrinema sp. LN54 TaxID=3458705 RepID=UPI004035FB05